MKGSLTNDGLPGYLQSLMITVSELFRDHNYHQWIAHSSHLLCCFHCKLIM